MQRHLAELERLGAVLFCNLEACPRCSSADAFRDVELFKQHPSRLDGGACVAAATKYWYDAERPGDSCSGSMTVSPSCVCRRDTRVAPCKFDLPSKQVARPPSPTMQTYGSRSTCTTS